MPSSSRKDSSKIKKKRQRRDKKSTTNNSNNSNSIMTIMTSTKVLIGIFVALTATTVIVNLVLISPLEEASIPWDFRDLVKAPAIMNADQIQPSNQQQQQQQQQRSSSTANGRKARISPEEGKKHILSIFQTAGVELTQEMIDALPTWDQVQDIVGDQGPIIYGLDKCQEFRDSVPPIERMLGSAGMFNTGTNLVTHLVKRNCEIPERREKFGPKATKEQYGMRWQVPWGKHTPAKFRLKHATEKASAIKKEWLLPVVTTRNPYSWFQRMCTNGYTVKWEHARARPDLCPNLVSEDGSWNEVTTKYADNRGETHQSLAHLWNDWYNDYVTQADYPFVVVRIEDLAFQAKETITAVCECAGGKIRTDQPFQYVVDSAKADSRGHDSSVGFYEAWLKYSKPYKPKAGLRDSDYEAAVGALDGHLMEAFGYAHPPAT